MEEIISHVDLEQKRASLLSMRKFSRITVRSDQDGKIIDPPQDKYHLLHLVFFILGMGSFVPMSFFLSANNYWMFKFRDLDKSTYDPTIKNTLQKNFQSTSSVISSISSIITNVVCSLFAHKLTLRVRLVSSMCITVTFFVIYTALVEIDTDSWQLEFFILTMIIYFLNNIAGTLFILTNMAMMSRFPPIYLKTNMYGSSLGILLGSVVQIVCIAIGGSTTQVALTYFSIGTVTCGLTLVAAYSVNFFPRFNFYQGDAVADTKKPLPTWGELKEVSINIWPQLLSTFINCMSMTTSGHSITALITSDHYDPQDPWTDQYFVPVLAFFLPGIIGLIGRIVASPIVNKSNVYIWLAASILYSLAIGPLLLFCNSKSKNHLPILFKKDWEFIILQIINGFGATYFHTTCFLSLPLFAGDKIELTFLVMTTMMGFFINVTSPLTSVWVNIQ